MKWLERFQEVIEAKLPDPLTFALALTAFMALLALTLTPTKSSELLMLWGDSLGSLLTFTMQIGLTIILAFVLSQTPIMQSGLRRLAALAKTPTQAYVLVILTAATFYLISWPLGPIWLVIHAGLWGSIVWGFILGIYTRVLSVTLLCIQSLSCL